MKQSKIPLTYYQQEDVVALAKDMIGKILVTNIDDKVCMGLITDTEAYSEFGDKACHAHLSKKTKRNQIMYEMGGVAYVYLCYGIHRLFNIVTHKTQADAILIRAVEPLIGIETMLSRRQKEKVDKTLSSGPGNMSKAMGIDLNHYGIPLLGNQIWLEEPREHFDGTIIETTRIGIDYAEEDRLLPWRFYHKESKFVSVR